MQTSDDETFRSGRAMSTTHGAPVLSIDLTILGLAEDFVARLPLDAPCDLEVGNVVLLADEDVEPRWFTVEELLADGEHARFTIAGT